MHKKSEKEVKFNFDEIKPYSTPRAKPSNQQDLEFERRKKEHQAKFK